MSQNNPKVSVIIPVYNTEKYLRECLDSVVNQTLRDIEIICVDDGSTDGSLEILHELASKDDRIKVLTQQKSNAGVARNNGMAVATGQYYMFWDSDDYFDLSALEEMYKRAEDFGADICLCGMERFFIDSNRKEAMPWVLRAKDIPFEPFNVRDVRDLFSISSPGPCSRLISAAFIHDHGLQFQSLPRINDMYFVYSAMALAERIVYIDKPFVHYRKGIDTSLQSRVFETPEVCCQALSKLHTTLRSSSNWIDIEESYICLVVSNLRFNLELFKEHPEAKSRLLKTFICEYYRTLGVEPFLIKDKALRATYNQILLEALIELEKDCGPKVSIVILSYNNSECIGRCLDSILHQTLTELEVVCVDDGSDDGTPSIIRTYADSNPRLQLIEKRTREGKISAWKTGALAAGGRYIMFVHANDCLSTTACETAYYSICECGADSLQFTYSVKDYPDGIETPGEGSIDLPVKAKTLNQSKAQEHLFITRKIQTELFGKIYKTSKCKLAFMNTPEINTKFGCDVYQQFFLSCFFDSFVKYPVISMNRGPQVASESDTEIIELDEYEQYCRMALLFRQLKQFSVQYRKEKTIEQCVHAIGIQMCEDCIGKWTKAVSDEEKNDAFKLYLQYWDGFSGRDAVFERLTGLSFREQCKKLTPISAYVRIGQAYNVETGKKPKISIIIPAYNGADYLRECIDSVQNQTLKEIEIILVNDGSYDNSLKIMEEYAAADDRITVLSQENQGLSCSRNKGMQYVRGTYIEFLDCDDMLTPNTASELFDYAESEKLDVLFFGATTIYENENLALQFSQYRQYYSFKSDFPAQNGQALFSAMQKKNCFRESACLALYRAAYLLENRLMFYPGILHEDTLFTFQALLLANHAARTGNNYYIRRIQSNSIMTREKTYRNMYGTLKCYTQMMAFVETHEIDELIMPEVVKFVTLIKQQIIRLNKTLPENELRKTASLTVIEKMWFDQIVRTENNSGKIAADQIVRTGNSSGKTAEILTVGDEAQLIRASASYKIGRFVTYIPRTIRGGIRCYREHGWSYTVDQVLKYFGLRK